MEQLGGKRIVNRWAVVLAVVFMALVGIAGCGGSDESEVEEVKKDVDMVPGNWVHYRNRTYILLSMDVKGTWSSAVRIADVTSKIVDSRGKASGTWHLDEGQLIFTVMESDIDNVWKKNDTCFYKVLELSDHLMILEGESGRKEEWKKTAHPKGGGDSGPVNPIVTMAPYAVNLDKHSSNAQDRYLCLNMHMELMELMPDQPVPQFHPRARDAVIMYLSALTYDDVSDFDRIKVQKEKVKDVLNPYMDGLIKEVIIDHVVIVVSPAKVEEFIIEHTPAPPKKEGAAEGEEGENGEESAQSEEAGETS